MKIKLTKTVFSLVFIALFSFQAQCARCDRVQKADEIILEKKKRLLTLKRKGKVLKTYRVALGFEPEDHKQQEGDGRTPEGKYKISWKHDGSRFYKSLKISYPNAQDRKSAKARGVSPGGDVFIHGLGKGFSFLGASHRLSDWTLGCVAVTNGEIDEIWKRVDWGTPIEILP